MAAFTAKLGQTVTLVIDGHSALNGAKIPEGSMVALSSNDTTVATVPATIDVPAGGAKQLNALVTLLATGATDCPVTVIDPAGTGSFQPYDVIQARLAYYEHKESYQVVQVNADFETTSPTITGTPVPTSNRREPVPLSPLTVVAAAGLAGG